MATVFKHNIVPILTGGKQEDHLTQRQTKSGGGRKIMCLSEEAVEGGAMIKLGG
jgi:hypothetical protein